MIVVTAMEKNTIEKNIIALKFFDLQLFKFEVIP